MVFYNKSVEETLKELDTTPQGLSHEEAAKRLEQYGKNALSEGKTSSWVIKFLKQLANPMIIILIVAAIISGVLSIWQEEKEYIDMIVIFAVVLINAIMGTVQEGKAEQAIAKLKNMSTPYTAVVRNGVPQMIPSSTLVPGDIIQIAAGDLISADIRIIKSNSIMAEESALTGESSAVEKIADTLEGDNIIVGDQKNMLFSSDKITYGTGLGVVTATGMQTEIGKIANILKETKNETTPLQKRMNEISTILTIAVLIICVLIFGINLIWAYVGAGKITLERIIELFTMSVSIAVAAIPEGLPAVVTLVLAFGVRKMSYRNAIVRKLNAVETLGCVQFICSDKTGTLTQNKMSVKKNYLDGQLFETELPKSKTADLFLKCLVLCNDSFADEQGERGDPTEIALIKLGAQNNKIQAEFNRIYERVFEVPFDSERKLMTTVNRTEDGLKVFTKGAVDNILKICTHIQLGDKIMPINDKHIAQINAANSELAGDALRVLAVAYKQVSGDINEMDAKDVESKLIFLGLTAMQDPPRPEVKDSIKICKTAGIKVVMITGDHKDTAIAIAKELNIIKDPKYATTGAELDNMSDEELRDKVNYFRVYARVSPEHKVRIVKALQANGNVVAMTGDGVNDAPALKTADIGVGMGITGSDVSKDVADMILTDDNFASIVTAVEEGRRIYANIKKSTRFLLSSNMSEILLLLIAALAGFDVLHTVQILFINLITDTFPAISLGSDPAEEDIMSQSPRRANASFFDSSLVINIVLQGIFMAGLTYAAYFAGRSMVSGMSETVLKEVPITMAFVTLSLIQLFHCLNIHKERKSIIGKNFFGNKALLISIASLIVFTVGIISIRPIAVVIRSVPLSLTQWLVVFGLAFAIIPLVEITKVISRAIWKTKIEKVY